MYDRRDPMFEKVNPGRAPRARFFRDALDNLIEWVADILVLLSAGRIGRIRRTKRR